MNGTAVESWCQTHFHLEGLTGCALFFTFCVFQDCEESEGEPTAVSFVHWSAY